MIKGVRTCAPMGPTPVVDPIVVGPTVVSATTVVTAAHGPPLVWPPLWTARCSALPGTRDRVFHPPICTL